MHNTKTPTILVVEDEPDLLETTLEFLEENALPAHGARTIRQMETAIATLAPDILILDLWLGQDDALDWLAQQACLPAHTQVIMVTARSGMDNRIRGLQHGADVYLEKPVHPDELLAVIRRLGARLLPLLADVWYFKAGAFSLIAPNGEGVRLTASQQKVIGALCEAADNACTREDLIKALGHDVDYFSNRRLEVMLKRLRQAIQDQSGIPAPLNTVYGWGYAFGAPLNPLR